MAKDVVTEVSYAGSSMRGEIFGMDRRRFWRDEDKLEIIMSVDRVGDAAHEQGQIESFDWPGDYSNKISLRQAVCADRAKRHD